MNSDPRKEELQFLGLEGEECRPETSKVVILPLPLEKTTTYGKGTANGPEAIIQASTQVELFDPELKVELNRLGIHTDWTLGDPSWNADPMETILDRIRKRTDKHLADGKFLLSLGGEHTITVGLIDPYLERWKGNLTVAHIDAHADLRDEYLGSKYNHACVMRRLLGRVPIVSAGIRSVSPEEYELGRGNNMRIFYAHEIRKNPKWIADFVSTIETPNVYLTVDVDGLDPSVVPSVGTPEPGGLYWEETLELIRTIAENHKIVGADVNELCPGPLAFADFAVAKLAYKILAYSFFAHGK